MLAARLGRTVGVVAVIGLLGSMASGAAARQTVHRQAGVRIVVTGGKQTVFDWSKQRCEDLDLPDLPARAFRDAHGRVQLIAAHYIDRRLVGRDLNHLEHPCGVILHSDFNPDPAAFDDHEWIASTWTSDGKTVYALLHDEYQGWTHPGQCPSGDWETCWWNTVTAAVSTDGGRTYTDATPSRLVASVPYRYVPDSGTFGPGWPTNIVRSGGYFYSIVYVKWQPVGQPDLDRNCLMRTTDLADPSSWRAWNDAAGFTTSFIDPYTDSSPPEPHFCQGVVPTTSEGMLVPGSLTYSTVARQWILVGVLADGFYYSLSPDLIHWTTPVRFYAGRAVWAYRCGKHDPIHYPSLIDPSSRSRNFQTVGAHAYLYFTDFHREGCSIGLDRDLVRVPVEIRAR